MCCWIVLAKETIKLYRNANEGEELVVDLASEKALKECRIGTNNSIGGLLQAEGTANVQRQESFIMFLGKQRFCVCVEFMSVVCEK